MSLDLVTYGHEVWMESGADPERPWILPIVGASGPAGDLAEQRAHWVSADTIIWPAADDPDAELPPAPRSRRRPGS